MVKLKQGDVIMVNLNPTSGSEQGGYRPAVVISKDYVINRTNIILVAPITSSIKQFPLNVQIKFDSRDGMVLCGHLKSIDIKSRNIKFVGCLSEEELYRCREVIVSMI